MEKYSLSKSILLHLLPGVFILLFYVLLTPTINRMGYPSLFSLLISVSLGILLEMGHLLYIGYKINGRISLKGVINTSERLPIWKFSLILFISFLIMIICVIGIVLFESSIKQAFFSKLAAWYFFDTNFASFSKKALITTALLRLLLDGLIIPIIEELYFRGYLLNRLPNYLKYKLIIAALLFTVYHFWQPWNYGSVLIAGILLVWPVYKYKNLYLSISLHILVNMISAILFLGQVGHLK
jgi:uncharacterized protein